MAIVSGPLVASKGTVVAECGGGLLIHQERGVLKTKRKKPCFLDRGPAGQPPDPRDLSHWGPKQEYEDEGDGHEKAWGAVEDELPICFGTW